MARHSYLGKGLIHSCVALLASFHNVSVRADTPTVLGLVFDEVPSIAECPFEVPKYTKLRVYLYPQEKFCFDPGLDITTGLQGMTGNVTLKFAASEVVPLTRGHDVTAVLVEGRLVELVFTTAGAADQERVLAQLVAKFGDPQSNEVATVSNQLGATVSSRHALWETGPLRVELMGTRNTIDAGLVSISSPEGAKMRKARALKAVTPTTPL